MRHRALLTAASALTALALVGCPGETGSTDGDAADMPAPQPTAAASPAMPTAEPPPKEPFDKATANTAWAKAEVGDWAVYKMLRFDKTFRFEVTNVGDDSVTYVRKNAETGEVMGEETVDLAEAEEKWQEPGSLDGVEGEPQTQSVEVDGKPLDVLVLKRSYGGNSTESWLHSELPPFMEVVGWAVVKSVRDGSLEFELLSFGGPAGSGE